MSQQKFASNVVEKCLTFGGPEERQLLVKEMLGSTYENAPLQVFKKSRASQILQYTVVIWDQLRDICEEVNKLSDMRIILFQHFFIPFTKFWYLL